MRPATSAGIRIHACLQLWGSSADRANAMLYCLYCLYCLSCRAKCRRSTLKQLGGAPPEPEFRSVRVASHNATLKCNTARQL